MKKEIGFVGVDSGQIVICDPCYIDSQWKKEEFNLKRTYKHRDGSIMKHTYKHRENDMEFHSYDDIIPKYGKSMNDMISNKDVKEIDDTTPPEHEFSYNACCKKTCGPDGMGQLNYEMGHAGVAVVSGNFGGDGTFPVIADIDKDGMVKSITIVFCCEEDEDNG